MLTLQVQETTLQPSALRALEDVKKSNIYNERLQSRLSKAIKLITDTSAQLNDRSVEETVIYSKKRNKLIANGGREDLEARERNEDYKAKIEALTQKMDSGIQKIIDDQMWLQDVPSALDHVRQKAGNASRIAVSTQATTQQSENDMEMEDNIEQDASASIIRPDASDAPTALLDAAFSTHHTKWQGKSKTERYSKHNDYVGWFRMVYDAKHPGENSPPMPHASTWFAAEEGRAAATVSASSQNQRQPRSDHRSSTVQSDSESDIEIAAEKVSIRCPITLLPYKDPLASTKCPHAFEKSAILDMFKHTSEHIPYTADQLAELSQISRPQDRNRREKEIRIPMVRCPECTVPLSENDLQPDPVLLRKANRILAKEQREKEAEQRHEEADIMDGEEDDDEDEGGPPRGTQRRNIVHLGSSPAVSARRQSGRVVKHERRTLVPTLMSDDE